LDYLNFASEDTRIAAPVLHSLKRFMAPEDLWPEGYSTLYLHGNKHPYPKTWLRYTTGESWKKTGPVEQFYDAADAASLVYRLGMAEALYYQDTVERQRRGRGSLRSLDFVMLRQIVLFTAQLHDCRDFYFHLLDHGADLVG
jgi:hypothetical protein